MEYVVNIVRYGCVIVKADSTSEAMEIANCMTTDEVNWSDDWEATDAYEDYK